MIFGDQPKSTQQICRGHHEKNNDDPAKNGKMQEKPSKTKTLGHVCTSQNLSHKKTLH
jgi:hypothetical protein